MTVEEEEEFSFIASYSRVYSQTYGKSNYIERRELFLVFEFHEVANDHRVHRVGSIWKEIQGGVSLSS